MTAAPATSLAEQPSETLFNFELYCGLLLFLAVQKHKYEVLHYVKIYVTHSVYVTVAHRLMAVATAEIC